MRLFLLPVSTRRTLIYCQKIPKDINTKPSIVDRATQKANETWTSWETAESGWRKKVTGWGNVLLRRIPFEEWGLKTIPPLSARTREGDIAQHQKVEVLYPGAFMKADKVSGVLEAIATERQGLHKQKMIWSLVGAPFTLPFALVPVVPNLPGIYVLFRAWSHWKAWRGGQHLEWLTKNRLTAPQSSSILNELYTAGLMHPTRQASREAATPTPQECEQVATTSAGQASEGRDTMLLKRWNGKLIAEQFKLPDMEVEIERAVEQVEASLKAADEAAANEKTSDETTATQAASKAVGSSAKTKEQ